MVELNLTVDDEKMNFSIPDCWNEVSVAQFADIYKIDKNLNRIPRTVKLVNILTGIEEENLYLMTPQQFAQLSEVLSFLGEEVKSSKVESIEIGGERYYLKNDFDNLNVGEVASIEYLLEGTFDVNNPTDATPLLKRYPELLCIFLRKKRENGKLESFRNEHMNRAELFKSVKIADVNSLFLFFSTGKVKSNATTKPFSAKQKKKGKRKGTDSKNSQEEQS